jgi:hypothetical protein
VDLEPGAAAHLPPARELLDGLVGRSAIRILADCYGLTKAAEEFGAGSSATT